MLDRILARYCAIAWRLEALSREVGDPIAEIDPATLPHAERWLDDTVFRIGLYATRMPRQPARPEAFAALEAEIERLCTEAPERDDAQQAA